MQIKRKQYIDVLRSIAILFMIEVHISAQLAPSDIPKNSILAIIVASIGGLAAPLFVTLSGWSNQNSLINKKKSLEPINSTFRGIIIKFLFLIVCQLIVNIIAGHVFNWYTPGILSLLAICTLLSIPLTKLSIKLKLLTFSILCLTPIIYSNIFEVNSSWSFLITVNNPIEWLYRLFINGTYPVFPWVIFFILGSILRDCNENLKMKIAVFGILMSSSFIIYSIINNIEWASTQNEALLTFFPASFAFIITASTTVLLLFIVFEKYDSKLKNIELVNHFTKIGKLSLSIYLLHFIPLRLLHELNLKDWDLSGAIILTLIFTFIWWPLSIIHNKWLKKYSLEYLLKYILATKNIPRSPVREP